MRTHTKEESDEIRQPSEDPSASVRHAWPAAGHGSAKRQKGRRQYLLSIEEVDGDGKKKRGEKEEMDGKLRGRESRYHIGFGHSPRESHGVRRP